MKKLSRSPLILAAAAAVTGSLLATSAANAQNVSQPVVLQWFDGSYKTMEYRAADYFMAGYGGLWTPPPGRADSGNGSVGYDVYDRFDLGYAGSSTQYGTENGLKRMITEIHKVGGKSYLDLVWNHNGFTDWQNTDGQGHTFLNAGGYPGFYMSTGNGNWGDFHDPSASGDENMQLSGLIDIDQATNHQFIRNPVQVGNAQNLPAGTQSAYGRLANVPTEANRRFYQDRSLPGLSVVDPLTGNSTLYDFGPTAATNGTPVTENATGLLMRNARWLIQEVGADGFRLDATKNFPNWALNYFDKAVYKAIKTPALDGSQQWVWSFGETFDSNWSVLASRTRLDQKYKPDNEVGGNRDSLDFSLYYAMQSNLSGNGLQNDWRNVVNSSFDGEDGYANDGSRGVAFVQSHDGSGSPPYLANVGYAYTLLRPGNGVVYFNGNEFGARGNNFPQQGRGDALGGQHGNTITKLVDIRNRYGRGNYQERWLDKETLVYERMNSVIAGYNNRIENGYDTRTVNTGFAAGTYLVELTGNATNGTVDPNDDIHDVVQVQPNGQITIRIPRNKNPNGVQHDKGYVMYGPATPQGTLTLSNVNNTIAPDTQNANNNGSARIASIDVIKTNSFNITLATTPVNLLVAKNPDVYHHDTDADGDNAIFKMDGGLDLNGNGQVDLRNYTVQDQNDPENPVARNPNLTSYGFEQFLTKNSSLYSGGDGEYIQNIDATQLSEGYHYLTARAFRHRDSGPALWSDFKKVIYIDRLAPVSAVQDIIQKPAGGANDKRINIKSTDQTANNVFVLVDVPAANTEAQILASLSGNGTTQTDRDIFARDVNNMVTGNHVFTIVTYELTGNYSIQRVPGNWVKTIYGDGLGDVDRNNQYQTFDITGFTTVLKSNNTQFNPTADFNGDGLIDLTDTFLYGPRLDTVGAAPAVYTAYTNNLLADTYVTTGSFTAAGAQTVNEVTAGNTTVPNGATLSVRSVYGPNNSNNSLTINNGGKVVVRANGTTTGVVRVKNLSVDATATLDLNDNDLVVNYTGSSPFSTLQNLVIDGYSDTVEPNRPGIISSTSQQLSGFTFLALFDNDTIGLTEWPIGSGVSIDSATVVGKYTYFGDVNLDGKVDDGDYGLVDAGYGSTPPAEIAILSGDANLDGVVGDSDYGMLDAAYGSGVGNPLIPAAFRASAMQPVPEPAAFGVLLSAAAAANLSRRRRRNR